MIELIELSNSRWLDEGGFRFRVSGSGFRVSRFAFQVSGFEGEIAKVKGREEAKSRENQFIIQILKNK